MQVPAMEEFSLVASSTVISIAVDRLLLQSKTSGSEVLRLSELLLLFLIYEFFYFSMDAFFVTLIFETYL